MCLGGESNTGRPPLQGRALPLSYPGSRTVYNSSLTFSINAILNSAFFEEGVVRKIRERSRPIKRTKKKKQATDGTPFIAIPVLPQKRLSREEIDGMIEFHQKYGVGGKIVVVELKSR